MCFIEAVQVLAGIGNRAITAERKPEMGIVPQRATTKFHLKVKFGSFVPTF